MKKFLLFIGGLIALAVLLANLGPMILLGVSVWLLYVIFKRFLKTESTAKKIAWVVLGLLVLSITLSHIYGIIGAAAGYGLYLVYKEWKKEKYNKEETEGKDDPFTNFEKQWAELNR
ncbi:flagellar basal body rod protein [Bacillus taeanensis]|uniref:Flagellar basal body rod protein n=1 Tax=Bacillus taeanensis TaxID=273032 RepID=A0A366XXL9_9BACI|nr:flagellar basal body rod protein [Bacillus taeanensis]RBW71140.1 flagellar basal body rod protein [Bacillus taeanensis]